MTITTARRLARIAQAENFTVAFVRYSGPWGYALDIAHPWSRIFDERIFDVAMFRAAITRLDAYVEAEMARRRLAQPAMPW